jgi:hypothetical protein
VPAQANVWCLSPPSAEQIAAIVGALGHQALHEQAIHRGPAALPDAWIEGRAKGGVQRWGCYPHEQAHQHSGPGHLQSTPSSLAPAVGEQTIHLQKNSPSSTWLMPRVGDSQSLQRTGMRRRRASPQGGSPARWAWSPAQPGERRGDSCGFLGKRRERGTRVGGASGSTSVNPHQPGEPRESRFFVREFCMKRPALSSISCSWSAAFPEVDRCYQEHLLPLRHLVWKECARSQLRTSRPLAGPSPFERLVIGT